MANVRVCDQGKMASNAILRLPRLQIAMKTYQQCCIYLNAEGDSQNVGKTSDSRHANGHDNSHRSRLISADCFLTHVGARIKACDSELGHQHANQKDVPAGASKHQGP